MAGEILDKTYAPESFEGRWYERWEAAGSFACAPDSDATPYTIMMPPPNVTGSLHIGHALTFTLQDILIRYHRMRGRDALWQPGMDHAGIATQMVVERMLDGEGVARRDLGREKFLERVWQWKDESGGTINRQLRSLGASPDWARERFTMDEGLSKAVRRVFVELYKEGLIYRDKRLVNWDPKLMTAISDLEVEQREVQGHYWHFKYPIENPDAGGQTHISIATSRPETILADGAVAVHPDDDRYKSLVGKMARLPIVNRLIPVIADEYPDPEKGSGAVKITSAHDFNDFEVGRRHGLELINILDAEARLNENAPDGWQGMDRYAARKRVIAEFDALGLLEKVEDITHTVPHGDRSGVVVEPWLLDQWYVDAKKLAVDAREIVKAGMQNKDYGIEIIPKHWAKTYFKWMDEIQPWCVSRQLWWGHRIPAWYAPDGSVFVAEDEAAAQAQAGEGVSLTQDEDVLDTWFSSALWPFSTLGWPEDKAEVARYYPGDVLVTGFDIIFFWVARMIMMGTYFMNRDAEKEKELDKNKDGYRNFIHRRPFEKVYIHALVRDEKGQKMSKSKGNVMDPLELTQKYGADALRFTLAAMAAQGRDINLGEKHIEVGRNFATKIWNSCRFLQMNGMIVDMAEIPDDIRRIKGLRESPIEGWIVTKFLKCRSKFYKSMKEYRFNDAATAIFRFIWSEYCDWYLESAKYAGRSEVGIVRIVASAVMAESLRLLHPIMPFFTEELFSNVFGDEKMLIVSRLPDDKENRNFPYMTERAATVDLVFGIIKEARSTKEQKKMPPKSRPIIFLKDIVPEGFGVQFPDDEPEKNPERYLNSLEFINSHKEVLCGMGKVKDIVELKYDEEFPNGSFSFSALGAFSCTLYLEGFESDVDAEKSRLEKGIKAAEAEIAILEKKLSNQEFLDKAPKHVVEKNRGRLDEEKKRKEHLESALIALNIE